MRRWPVLAALVAAAILIPAGSAYACSTDDTTWVESFLDQSCLGPLNNTELDTLGGLRLKTNGAPTTTTWTSQADFTGGVTYQTKTFGPIGYPSLLATPSDTLELGTTSLALTRDPAAASVLDPTASTAPDNDHVDDPTVVKDTTLPQPYVMFYSGYAEDGSGPAIFRATSPDGRVWTKRDADTNDPDLDPVLDASAGAEALDRHGVYGADVLLDPNGGAERYKMYYAGRADVFDRIALATSPDGIVWTKYDDGDADTDPEIILDRGRPGARDSFAAAHPAVLKDGASWKMWYEGSDSNQKSILYATSADGLTWSKGGAVIEPGSGNVEFGAFAPTVWKTGTTSYKMLLGVQKETGNNTGIFQTKVQEASSSDGVEWNVGSVAMNPGGPGRFDEFDLNSPDILEDPGAGSSAFKLYYSGTRPDNSGEHSRIGLSQTSNGSGWQGGKFNGSGDGQSVLDISPLTASEPFDARHASGVAATAAPGGGFVGAYWGTRGFDFLPRLGQVTSADGSSWTKVAGTQTDGSLLPLGGNNAFDQFGQRDPSLLYSLNANGTKDYHLYFTGIDDAGLTRIGYAGADETAGTLVPDNATWVKYTNAPTDHALFSGGGGTFDDGGVSDPYVVRDPNGTNAGTYVMYYTGANAGVSRIGRATAASPTGALTASATAVLNPGLAGSFDATSVEDPVVLADAAVNDKWHLVYTAVETIDGEQTRRVAYATSTDDGVTWVKAGLALNPSLGPFEFDEAGVQPQGVHADGTDVHVWFDGLDRTGRARGGHATVPIAALSGLLENGWSTYQLGDTTTTVRDWRTIMATATGGGTKELWVSFLQPYSSAGKEYWSDPFPVDGINAAGPLNFLLTVKGVRWQARLADPTGTPAISAVDLEHADISFFAAGDGTTTAIAAPNPQTVTTWRTLTVTSDLFQPTGSGSGGGTVKVLDASETTVLASTALNTNGDTTLDLSGISAATHPTLKLKLELSSASPFTASPVVRLAKVLYFTNVSQPALTLTASATTVNAGDAVTLSGQLTRGGTGLAGETVTIANAGTATTDASGNYSLVVNPTATTTYTATAIGTSSAPVTVTVNPPPPPPPAITLAATPAEVVFGQPVTLAGKLTQAAAPLSGQAVQLLAAGSPFGTATTNATGDYSGTHTPQANTAYTASFGGVTSAPANVGVHQLVKLTGKRSRGNVVFSGSIAPAHPGREVVIQLKKGTGFVTFVKAKTGSTSRFTARKKLKVCGKFQFRAVTAADADHMDGTSAVALVEKHRVSLKVAVKGRKATFTGKVSPLHKSGSVILQLKKGTRFVKYAKVKLTRKSTFRAVKRLKKGRYTFRASMGSDRCHFAGLSTARNARVR